VCRQNISDILDDMETENIEKKEIKNINTDLKSNIALILSIAALGASIFGGGMNLTGSSLPEGPEGNIKQLAKDAGISSRTYDKCIVDPSIVALVDADVADTNAIVAFAELQGIGTPFNLVITDTQVIPVSGAYPYEFFNLMIQTINETGTVNQDILDQFEIVPMDYGITEIIPGFDPSSDHYKGSVNPEITIIEYSDFECPFCSRIHGTLEQLVRENDNIAWAYRHLPLGFHPQAYPAAIASECVAREEGNEAFWLFTDALFADQSVLQE
jgi:hypothetical protein